MTWLAWHSSAFAAATALLGLALGDGMGGVVGRRFGRHLYAFAGGKRKSVEGSAAVAVGAAIGAWIASAYFGASASAPMLIGIGLVASAAEAASPRASDNAILPAAVWLFARAIA
jgi:dolichol kinase